jgi:hypothetical protein
MHPIIWNYPKKTTRPRHLSDYDLALGFYNLQQRHSSADQSVWTTSWIKNLAFLAFTAFLLGVVYIGNQYSPNLSEMSTGNFIGSMIFQGMFLVGGILTLRIGIHRGKVIVDNRRQQLQFHRLLRRPRTLNCQEIKVLRHEYFDVPDSDGGGHTYNILVADLKDGTTASLAYDAPAGFEAEIKAIM